MPAAGMVCFSLIGDVTGVRRLGVHFRHRGTVVVNPR